MLLALLLLLLPLSLPLPRPDQPSVPLMRAYDRVETPVVAKTLEGAWEERKQPQLLVLAWHVPRRGNGGRSRAMASLLEAPASAVDDSSGRRRAAAGPMLLLLPHLSPANMMLKVCLLTVYSAGECQQGGLVLNAEELVWHRAVPRGDPGVLYQVGTARST